MRVRPNHCRMRWHSLGRVLASCKETGESPGAKGQNTSPGTSSPRSSRSRRKRGRALGKPKDDAPRSRRMERAAALDDELQLYNRPQAPARQWALDHLAALATGHRPSLIDSHSGAPGSHGDRRTAGLIWHSLTRPQGPSVSRACVDCAWSQVSRCHEDLVYCTAALRSYLYLHAILLRLVSVRVSSVCRVRVCARTCGSRASIRLVHTRAVACRA